MPLIVHGVSLFRERADEILCSQPKSRKHHEIIEKTAFFINDQGAQMEILLKMKQADNPQFNFLSFDGELHPYYRHMMAAIKSGRYKFTAPAPVSKGIHCSRGSYSYWLGQHDT